MKQVSEFVPIRFRTGFNDDGREAGAAAGIRCEDPSLTVQDAKGDTDINTIMSRYVQGGLAPQVVRVPLEGDFTEITDLRGALEAVRAAQESFANLDAKVRARFDHDPAKFHDFCVDPANLEELRKLGLAVPAPAAAAAPGAPASPPSPAQ